MARHTIAEEVVRRQSVSMTQETRADVQMDQAMTVLRDQIALARQRKERAGSGVS